MAILEATWDSCRLYVASATAKLPATRRNPAETRSMESPGKIAISPDQKAAKLDRRVSVAPMMDWTDDRQTSLYVRLLRSLGNACLLYVSSSRGSKAQVCGNLPRRVGCES
jgi:hypothetical protein